jgi:hypothetical protein
LAYEVYSPSALKAGQVIFSAIEAWRTSGKQATEAEITLFVTFDYGEHM